MSNIDLFTNVLNSDFVSKENTLEEPKENMKIPLDNSGCNSIVFKFDTQLGKEFKGGIFPFLNRGETGVCKVCDYIIFAEQNGKTFAIVIELKLGKDGTQKQLNSGICISTFIKDTVNRVYNKKIKLIQRKVSIHEFKRKNRTKLKEIEYNENNTHIFTQNTFRVQEFLK
ncbi:hypothetical protein [Flavicella sediminum]|uniref:hypothetical protein n=1 Tax=Flavicella sediminum TaxID=2585141 RepID=UPI0011233357|nr:hypothetical protein [Flavicella sediminum]